MKLASWKKKIKPFVIGAILLCLPSLLISCAEPRTIVRTEYVYVLPPEQYLQEYPEPELQGNKNRHLRDWALDLRETNQLHESDKQALREWRRDMKRNAR